MNPSHSANPQSDSTVDGAATPDMAAVHRGAVRGSVLSLADQAIRAGLGVLTSLVVAAYVGPDGFGLVALAVSVEAFLIILRNSGFSGALIQRKDVSELQVNTVFWIGIIVSAVLVVGLLLAAEPLARFYERPQMKPILLVLTLSVAAQAFSGVQEALMRKELRFGQLAVANSGSAAIASIGAIIAAALGAGVWALVLRIVVTRVFMAAICWWLSPWRPRLQLDLRTARPLLSFGGYLFLSALMAFGNTRLDSPIIGKLIGLGAAGLFFMARNLALSIIRQGIGAISQVMFAVFSAVQNDPATLRTGYLTGTRFLGVLFFPAIAGMIAISPEAVPVLLKGDWRGITPIIQVISLQGVALCTNAGISPILLACGRSRFMFILNLLRTVLAIGSFFVGCRWGVLGVATTWTVAAIAWAPVEMWFVCRQVGMSIVTVFANVARPTIAATIAAVAVRTLAWALAPDDGSSSLALVLLEAAVGVVSYGILTAALDRATLVKLKNDLKRSFGR